MKISRRKSIFLALAATLTLSGVAVAALYMAFSTTNTIAVGNKLSAAAAALAFDANHVSHVFTAGEQCTGGPITWTCPQSVIPSTIFGGDNLTYFMQLTSQKVGETPTASYASSYSGLSLQSFNALYAGPGCSGALGAWTSGYPTWTTSGACYAFEVVLTVTGGQTSTVSVATQVDG